jgi:hypothetical protein
VIGEENRMGDTVEVSIPVDAAAAALLADAGKRAAIGRIISDMLHRHPDGDPLGRVMDRVGAEAARLGLTQDVLDEELAAYNAEDREHGSRRS